MSTRDFFSLQYPIGKFEWTTTQPSSKEKKEILDVLKNFPAFIEREIVGLKKMYYKPLIERVDGQ